MKDAFKISFCGDTSLGYYYLQRSAARYPEAYKRLQQEPAAFFQQVAPVLENSQYRIVNLETVLSTLGQPIAGKQYPGRDDAGVTIGILQQLGINAVLLANNHSMDFGADALLDMIAQLKHAGIAVVGAGENDAEACAPYIIPHPHSGQNIYIFNAMLSGKRYRDYGFYATANSPGVASADSEYWAERIMVLREQEPDATIIISPHWQGCDYKPVQDKHREWCREMILCGADYIIAHGTHSADVIEQFEQGQIFYSIGNFVFNSPGRYQAFAANPHSLIVSLSATDTGWQSSAQKIVTDNKLTQFNVTLSEPEQPVTAQLYQDDTDTLAATLTIEQWLEAIAPDGRYFYQGDSHAICAGFSSSFHDYRPGCFFVLRDSSWPKEKHHQQNKSLHDIISRAQALGYNNFVAPEALAEPLLQLLPQANLLIIDHTFHLVRNAANFMRRYSQCRLVAVTGSAGKSSTVAMLLQTLAAEPNCASLFHTNGNNRNLFQDSIHSLTKLQGHDLAVLEVSASKKFASYQFYLRPDIAIFTSLSYAHSQHLGHIADIALVKATLFHDMPAGGTAIINADMPCLDFVVAQARKAAVNIILYGESVQAQVRLLNYDFDSGRVEARFFGDTVFYPMAQLGKHQVLNSLAVLIALKQLGLNWQQHAQRLHQFSPSAGRGLLKHCRIGGQHITILDESYNANPASMLASLTLLGQLKRKHQGRSVAVLADMLELGEQSVKQHLALLPAILNTETDQVILIGPQMQPLWQQLPERIKGAWFSDVNDVSQHLKQQLQDGDIVLFKGSAAMQLDTVLSQLVS